MSASSEINLKQALRKTEFPMCAKEALNKIGELICGRSVSIKNMDLALDLMAEFIFCEVDRRGNKKQIQLTPLQELQLLEILFEYFGSIQNETARNTVFLSLFSGTTATLRAPILSKLVSIAVGVSTYQSPLILLSASTWMQQLGNTSANCCKLAEALIKDYFHLALNPSTKLQNLPVVAPQFCANFLTAVAEIYFLDHKKEQCFPPDSLLELITYWVSEYSSLCIAAQQRQTVLPPGAIAMEATTPIAGLVKWCILAPLYNLPSKLYCRLHLALLNSICEIPVTSPPKAICAQHLAIPIRSVFILGKQRNEHCIANLQVALDRYAQVVQVALCSKCVYGKVDEMLTNLQKLPHNKLLSVVINTHRHSK